jgi:phage gp45-like
LAQGRAREKIGGQKRKVHKVGTHGLISVPWNGSLGWSTPIGSNPDQAMAHGFEHPDKRYREGEEGDAGVYRDPNNYCVFKKDKVYLKTQYPVIVEADGDITLQASNIYLVGNVYLGSKTASRKVSAQGTVDTGGFVDTSNPLTKVYGI